MLRTLVNVLRQSRGVAALVPRALTTPPLWQERPRHLQLQRYRRFHDPINGRELLHYRGTNPRNFFLSPSPTNQLRIRYY
jgi:hypothetical protein